MRVKFSSLVRYNGGQVKNKIIFPTYEDSYYSVVKCDIPSFRLLHEK